MVISVMTLGFALSNAKVNQNGTLPKNFGMILFPAFQALDVFGPLDVLNLLSLQRQLNLTLIADTLDPVSTKPMSAAMNAYNSTFGESVLPTHTFSQPPENLDVLIVPGGLGTRAPNLNSSIEYIGKVYPELKYLITICTGAGVAARSGVMDGLNATTNKRSWASTIALRPQVNWISHARWVVDKNIWSSSGVSAGIDAMLAFIGEIYGDSVATNIANGMEYERHTNSTWDPFADLYNLTDSISSR